MLNERYNHLSESVGTSPWTLEDGNTWQGWLKREREESQAGEKQARGLTVRGVRPICHRIWEGGDPGLDPHHCVSESDRQPGSYDGCCLCDHFSLFTPEFAYLSRSHPHTMTHMEMSRHLCGLLWRAVCVFEATRDGYWEVEGRTALIIATRSLPHYNKAQGCRYQGFLPMASMEAGMAASGSLPMDCTSS